MMRGREGIITEDRNIQTLQVNPSLMVKRMMSYCSGAIHFLAYKNTGGYC